MVRWCLVSKNSLGGIEMISLGAETFCKLKVVPELDAPPLLPYFRQCGDHGLQVFNLDSEEVGVSLRLVATLFSAYAVHKQVATKLDLVLHRGHDDRESFVFEPAVLGELFLPSVLKLGKYLNEKLATRLGWIDFDVFQGEKSLTRLRFMVLPGISKFS